MHTRNVLVFLGLACVASAVPAPLNINLGAYSPALVVGDGAISFGGGEGEAAAGAEAVEVGAGAGQEATPATEPATQPATQPATEEASTAALSTQAVRYHDQQHAPWGVLAPPTGKGFAS